MWWISSIIANVKRIADALEMSAKVDLAGYAEQMQQGKALADARDTTAKVYEEIRKQAVAMEKHRADCAKWHNDVLAQLGVGEAPKKAKERVH